MLRTALLFPLLLPAVAHEEGGSAMNAPAPPTDLNAIDFALADDELVSYEDQLFACVKLTLAPEEGEQKWVRAANVQYATDLPPTAKVLPRKKAWGKKSLSKKDQACKEAGGVYVRLDRLQSFVNGAVDNATDAGDCEAPDAAGSAKPESPLAKGIKAWNDRFFNMDTAETRQNAELFHGRGSEPKHLAQEVTHFVMPLEVQARINERLATHRTLLLGDEGAGQGGTTGAHFLSGNVGFGNAGQGANLMDLVFPHGSNATADQTLFDDGYDRRRGGVLSGEVTTTEDGQHDGYDGAERPPDMLAFEKEVQRLLLARSDVHYMYGDEVDFQFQHRLWRYGPNFDPKAKGGIWHKDTCPFGINGELPEGSIMFTIVYILFTENLDGPTAGTRVRDADGTIFSLPCIAGEGNIIRSGESDQNAFFHSGPLNIRKEDPSKPAYRVMLQSKAILRPSTGRPRAIPTKGNWRGLKVPSLAIEAAAAPYDKLHAVEDWLEHASHTLTDGVGESNAVGFEAYPINVHRAWEVTRDLCTFLGFQTRGFLPESDIPATPVIVFGFDERYSLQLVDNLEEHGFRVVLVGSTEDFDALRQSKQDVYSNTQTVHLDNSKRVTHILSNSPYDLNLVVDLPPTGPRALKGGLLGVYGGVLSRVAAKAKGEGRVATVTFLSQQMPQGGRDGGDQSKAKGALSALQRGFLQAEQEWVAWGEKHGVRVVVMRVADRVYAPSHSALERVATGKKPNPCRVEQCAHDEPLTRVHAEDLIGVLRRMLAMFDIVDTHGADSSMQGTASLSSSISRFPTGTVLDVVDDGPPHSMAQAEAWSASAFGEFLTPGTPLAHAIMGANAEKKAADAEAPAPETPANRAYRSASGRNADLKAALGMPKLRYPTYLHGGAKIFAAGEF